MKTKPYIISKDVVWRAWQQVKANQGAAGVDGQTITEFEVRLRDNLYRIWNRMSSGSYFPSPVRVVEIPKADGGKRSLGIPTVTDRVAQMVVKLYLEPEVEPVFHPDSYGYRPGTSALEAVGVTRQRCWRNNWVIDLDIKGFFDNIDHNLMMHAVRKHTQSPWILLYVERWMKAPAIDPDGVIRPRQQGTPQGGVISPLLANIFLHHVFDTWMAKTFPANSFARYADDIIVHCRTRKQSRYILDQIGQRMRRCRLQLHPEKTQIVYCQDGQRQESHPVTTFDFLGYTFRPRLAISQHGVFVSFLPGISQKAMKRIRAQMRSWLIPRKAEKGLHELSRLYRRQIRGWINYYGKYYKTALRPLFRNLNMRLVKWVRRKYKRCRRQREASRWLRAVARKQPTLFPHWEFGMYP